MSRYRPQEIKPTVRILKLLLVEAEGSKDMWHRPYEMDLGHDDVSRVEDIVARSLATTNTNAIQGMMANEMPNILAPSAMVSGKANIINGWGERRFKFVLIVEMSQSGSSASVINYIQGYTEYLGISRSDHLDENMRFFTNSVLKLKRYVDSVSGRVHTVPLESYNVVHDETREVNNAYESKKLARPSDITMNIASVMDLDEDESVVAMSNVGSVNSHELVNKTSLLPNDHVATTIKNAIDAKRNVGYLGENGDVVSSMVGNLSEPSIYNVDFFKTILDIKGRSEDFTLGDLALIEPNINNIIETVIGINDGVTNYDLPRELFTEDSADTYDSSLETRMSLVALEAVVAILDKSALNSIVFEIDNYKGEPDAHILDSGSFIENYDLVTAANMFVTSFIQRAWNTITNNNNTIVSLLVMGMLESKTTIIITLDGRPPITYKYPTFSNSKFLPVIMENKDLDVLTEDYNTLIEATLGTVGNAMNQQNRPPIITEEKLYRV